MTNMTLEERVQYALNEIRPFLLNDGGDISLVCITPENVVQVQLHGACKGCSVNQMTLTSGVEMTVKKYAPEVVRVENTARKPHAI